MKKKIDVDVEIDQETKWAGIFCCKTINSDSRTKNIPYNEVMKGLGQSILIFIKASCLQIDIDIHKG